MPISLRVTIFHAPYCRPWQMGQLRLLTVPNNHKHHRFGQTFQTIVLPLATAATITARILVVDTITMALSSRRVTGELEITRGTILAVDEGEGVGGEVAGRMTSPQCRDSHHLTNIIVVAENIPPIGLSLSGLARIETWWAIGFIALRCCYMYTAFPQHHPIMLHLFFVCGIALSLRSQVPKALMVAVSGSPCRSPRHHQNSRLSCRQCSP